MKHNVEKKDNKGQVIPTLVLIVFAAVVGILTQLAYSNELFINITSIYLIPLFFAIMDLEKVFSNKKRIGIAIGLILILTIAYSLTSFPAMMQVSPEESQFDKVWFYGGIFFLAIIFAILTFAVWFSSNRESNKFQRTQKLLERTRKKKKEIKKEYREVKTENDDIRNENHKLNEEKKELEDRLSKELSKKYIPIIKCEKLEIGVKRLER